MKKTLDLDVWFQGVEAPLRLRDGDAIRDTLEAVALKWPLDIRAATFTSRPFFSIEAGSKPGKFATRSFVQEKDDRTLDHVNAICDMVAALPYALADSDRTLICLHAAGVRMGKKLVVFPNIRRAGKSTLSCALAHAGYGVFSDDVLPTSFGEGGQAIGHAMGIAPRLRVPLPDSASEDFKNWVATNSGPANKQYKYLDLPDQPGRGDVLDIGAFVILDRSETATEPSLTTVSPDKAMNALLHQNFTRDRHSIDLLAKFADVLTTLPSYQLHYFDLESAIDCLEAEFAADPNMSSKSARAADQSLRLADFESKLPGKLDLASAVNRRAGVFEQAIGDTLYLADPEGRGIRQMDPLAAAIWSLLDGAITPAEISSILQDAFPDVPPDTITDDVSSLLKKLSKAGLIANV